MGDSFTELGKDGKGSGWVGVFGVPRTEAQYTELFLAQGFDLSSANERGFLSHRFRRCRGGGVLLVF